MIQTQPTSFQELVSSIQASLLVYQKETNDKISQLEATVQKASYAQSYQIHGPGQANRPAGASHGPTQPKAHKHRNVPTKAHAPNVTGQNDWEKKPASTILLGSPLSPMYGVIQDARNLEAFGNSTTQPQIIFLRPGSAVIVNELGKGGRKEGRDAKHHHGQIPDTGSASSENLYQDVDASISKSGARYGAAAQGNTGGGGSDGSDSGSSTPRSSSSVSSSLSSSSTSTASDEEGGKWETVRSDKKKRAKKQKNRNEKAKKQKREEKNGEEAEKKYQP